ncbi:MAG: response regulator, partial [Victivallales bacterium]|nr:response regulator [Victivallales bacterium]
REYADMIMTTSERAANLTGKLLSFSRKGKIFSSPTDVHASIRDAVAILTRSVDKRVTVSFAPDATDAVIIGDPTQLQNMVINLGINAAHAMPDGGQLRLATRDVELDAEFCRNCRDCSLTPGRYLELTVSDEGSGIKPEDLPHIFEPFFTTKTEGHGTGLGLAAVYGSVREHRGAIRVDSKRGHGSVFTIYLPLCQNCSSATGPAAPEFTLPNRFHGTVLLADDENIIRAATTSMLEDAGMTVVTAVDGAAALELFRRDPDRFDLVIMDMVMPQMTGEDCFYAMKKLRPELKVIMVSGFANEEKVAGMKEFGLIAMIKKPFRRHDLLQLLNLCFPSEDTPK